MTSYLKPIIVSSEESLHKIFNDLIPLKKKMVSANVKIEYPAISLSSHYIRGEKKENAFLYGKIDLEKCSDRSSIEKS